MHSHRFRLFNVTLIACFSLLLSSINSFAAEPAGPNYNNYAGFWTQSVAEGNLSSIDDSLSKVRAWVEGQARFNNNTEKVGSNGQFASNGNTSGNMDWHQGMARTALGYAVTDRLTVWAGYTYLPTHNYGAPYSGEQDLWPAARYIFPTPFGSVMLREMVEFRYLTGVTSTPAIRPRTLIKLIHPFEFEPRLGLVLWNEAFFNVNTVTGIAGNQGYSGFNQNRAFAGFSWTFNESVRSEFGYMDQLSLVSKPGNTTAFNNLNAVSASVFVGW